MSTSDPRYRQLRIRSRGADLVPQAPAWTAQAVCARVGRPADWEPDLEDTDAVRAATEACAHCPVRSQCLEDALARPELARGGIRGGLTEPQRRRLQRSRTRSAPPERLVPALEAIRIVRTLAADGHPRSRVEREARVSRSMLTALRQGRTERVPARVAERLRRAYRRIRSTDPGSGAHACGTRRVAAARGWAPSAAWQGLDMADPAAGPRTTGRVA